MSLYQKYELLEPLHDDGVKTFRGRDNASGRAVEVHLFLGQAGKAEPPVELMEEVKRLSPGDSTRLIEFGEHMGTPYVVTLPLEGFRSFREWVAAQKSAAAAAPAKPSSDPLSRVGRWKIPLAPPPQAGAQPETETLRTPVAPAPAAMVPRSASAPPAPARDDFEKMFGTPSASQPEAGEFTRQFQAASPGPQIRPSEEPITRPGEFTHFMMKTGQNPVAQKASFAPAPVSGPTTTGESPVVREPVASKDSEATAEVPFAGLTPPKTSEFDQLFSAPAAPSLTGQMPVPSTVRPAPAGDVTRMFSTQSAPAAQPPAAIPSKPAEGGEFTRMFATPGLTGQMPTAPAAPSAPAPPLAPTPPAPTPAKPAEGGEFTRMFATPGLTGQMPTAPATPSPAVPLAPPPAPPTPAKPAAGGEFTSMFATPGLTGQAPATPATPSAPAAPLAPPPTPPTQAKPAEGGEFTRMFATPGLTGQMPTAPAPVAPAAPPPPAPTPAKPAEGGEFTRMFATPGLTGQMPATPATPSAPAAPLAPPPTPPAQAKPAAGGEFTRMFATPGLTGQMPATPATPLAPTTPSVPPPAPPAQAKPAAGGEFTSMFAAPPTPGLTGQMPAPPPVAKPALPTPAPQPEPAGEFTRMFSSMGPPRPSAPPAGAQQAAGEFTSMFKSAPSGPSGAPLGSQPPPAKQEPGEYTRMFQSPPQAPIGEPLPPVSGAPGGGGFPGGFQAAGPKQALPVAAPQQSPFGAPQFGQPSLPPAPVPFGQQGVPSTPFGQPAQPSPFGQPASPFGGATGTPLGAPQASPFQAGQIGAIPERPYAGPSTPSVQDEYSKLFGPGDRPAASAPPPAPPPLQTPMGFGSATQSFSVPGNLPGAGGGQPAQSDYTRMIQRPAEMQKPPAPAPAPKPPAPAKSQPKWPLIVFGVLFVILIIVGIIMFTKK
ncbi:MAG: hypothetical protein JNL98_29535 [Bryobacterales bacterium]|nr:hypothetical protein [Bryobacterales bacterium]